MKLAILTVTEGGKRQALKLREQLPNSQVYILSQFYKGEENVLLIEPSLKEQVKDIFSQVEGLIFIMATGIVVRTIAPLLQDKRKDPAVVVMDEEGKNVISLLSGHIGGANALTKTVAAFIGANPVITTASDVRGKIAVDTLAQELDCRIKDWEKTKKLTACIVKGEEVAIYSEKILPNPPKGYTIVNELQQLLDVPYGIYIGNKNIEDKYPQVLQLYTRDLVMGIGCRKDIDDSVVMEAIKTALKEIDRSLDSLKKLVTIDLKSKEPALITASETFKIPLEILAREELKEIENKFETSDFVKKSIGVGAVSEPCAYLGSKGGKILLNKQKYNGVTISIAEEGDE
ncbi:MAG: cobalt-precorrin 5A hydrolase [Clostridiaceae bacterium]|nr:cobalt-precorrin 5A hydrolase [Clostridiaceae bacterium]